jgi:hypothetical protein
MSVRNAQQNDWARLGAAARLSQIQEERTLILRVFPELRNGRAAQRLGLGGPTRRRTISPAGRKAMSAGMRKYWARRKAEEAKRG